MLDLTKLVGRGIVGNSPSRTQTVNSNSTANTTKVHQQGFVRQYGLKNTRARSQESKRALRSLVEPRRDPMRYAWLWCQLAVGPAERAPSSRPRGGEDSTAPVPLMAGDRQ